MALQSVSSIRGIADDFRNNRSDAYFKFAKLTNEEKNKIFESVWIKKGRSNPHPQFGEFAFYGRHFQVSNNTRAKATEMLSNEVLSNYLRNISNDFRDNRVQQAFDKFAMMASDDKYVIYENTWMLASNPQPHPRFGELAFLGQQFRISNDIRAQAIDNYADALKEILIKKWFIDDNIEFSVTLRNEQFELLVFNRTTRESSKEVLDTSGRAIKSVIAFFKQCDASFIDGHPHFSAPRSLPGEWPYSISAANESSAMVRLAWKGTDLVWRLFDRTTNTESWIYADVNANGLREYLEGVPTEGGTTYLKDFKVDIHVLKVGRNDKLRSVFVSKITQLSQMDEKTLLDKDRWAVTLISVGYSSLLHVPIVNRTLKDPICGHAMIVYEGIKNGERFLSYAHITGSPDDEMFPNRNSNEFQVEFDENSSKRKFHAQTPTWSRSRILVEQMVNSMRNDQARPIVTTPTGNPVLTGGFAQTAAKCTKFAFQASCSLEGVYMLASAFPLRNKMTPINEYIEKKNSGTADARESGSLIQRLDCWMEKGMYGKAEELMEDLDKGSKEWTRAKNCLIWDLEKLKVVGIILPFPEIGSPTQYVKSIASQPSLARLT